MNHKHYWSSEKPYKGEINDLPSLTQPFQGFRPCEIVERVRAGAPLPPARTPHYLGDVAQIEPSAYMDFSIERMQELAEQGAHTEAYYRGIAENANKPKSPDPVSDPAKGAPGTGE